MFKAGPVLEIETDLSGNVTYSHKKIAAPTEEKESFNINKYLTGIKTDSYGHIISFNTADLDLNKYATNEEAKANGGIRYINQSEIDKLNKLIIQDDDIVISSSVNAENVIGLNEWLTANRDNVSGLVSNKLENNVSKVISDLNILFSKVENTQTQISSIESELNKYLLASTFDETIEPIKSEIDELKAAMVWTPME